MKSKGADAGARAAPPACPLCGGQARTLYEMDHTDVWRCAGSRCGLDFAYPQLDDRALDQAYATLYYPGDDGTKPHLENTPESDIHGFLRLMEADLGSLRGKRVLDYGCGNGALLRIAAGMGAQVSGIEQSAVARDTIQSSGLGKAYRDATSLLAAEPSARFDWIILNSVIEHLREPWNEVASLVPLLDATGQLIVITPNADSLKSRVKGSGWDQRQNQTHFYYFTSRSLTACLRRAGLRDVRERPALAVYDGHGPVRRILQYALRAAGLQGALLFVGASPTASSK